MKKKVREWVELARIDLAAAKRLSGDDLVTSAASFHAHQCVEKLFKALIENADNVVPKIHDLDRLKSQIKGPIDFEFDEDILDDLSRLYIDSRYPSMIGLMPYGRPTIPDTKRYVDFAEKVFESIVTLIGNSD
ncbi:MAG TPA: HEPN domain-containing protein [Spirochaetota bacterium]|nr:HEPN domain-containing protein [Spirochaetota bacterium]HPJ38952.1 HEPN domain-containing protein [Spirochaetota bacterium]HPQ55236.1 HEPN domain-containing protein [Spirochaetota bacterium]